MARCVDILKDFMFSMKNMYFNNKDIFDVHISDFVCRIETFYIEVYLKTLSIELNSLNELRVFIADNILELIEKSKKVSASITKEVFNDLTLLAKNKITFDHDSLFKLNNYEQTKELSIQEKNEIMLKGVMYFEYNDKVISNRLFVRKIFVGSLLMVMSIIGCIFLFCLIQFICFFIYCQYYIAFI